MKYANEHDSRALLATHEAVVRLAGAHKGSVQHIEVSAEFCRKNSAAVAEAIHGEIRTFPMSNRAVSFTPYDMQQPQVYIPGDAWEVEDIGAILKRAVAA